MLSTAAAVSVKTRGELNDAIHARPPQRPFRSAFILTTRTCAAARNDCVSYNHVIKEDTMDAYATATTTGGTASRIDEFYGVPSYWTDRTNRERIA
jgi:hypothetical protein